ncbi:MAG TPA: DUF202 domain-containing protein [Gallionellaceae bacterium]|nr:DUF202 domain-containing protein [Gallionellaceae bacterium]
MADNLYSKFDTAELILRDHLAIDRTLLANERTLLSYLRSGVALFIAGISIVHFAHQGWFADFGYACLPVGVVTVFFGATRYRRMDKAISIVRQDLDSIASVAGAGDK